MTAEHERDEQDDNAPSNGGSDEGSESGGDGGERTFGTVITQQEPDQRIAWTTVPDSEVVHAGVVNLS